MNKMCVKLLALLAISLTCVHSSKLDTSLKVHSAILDKFQTSIKEFSKTLMSGLGGSVKMEMLVNDVISKDLALQVDQLSLLTNGTLAPALNDICCECNRCYTRCQQCGQSCCCNGDQGCTCIVCSSSHAESVKVDDVGVTSSSTVKLWAESSKRQLRRDLGRVVALNAKASDFCCVCDVCDSHIATAGKTECCISGSICSCKTCSSSVFADSITNLVSLTPEAEVAVGQVDALVDKLLVLLTYA